MIPPPFFYHYTRVRATLEAGKTENMKN